MNINVNYIDSLALPSTSDAAYRKTVCSGIIHFSEERSLSLFEGMLSFSVALVDGGVPSNHFPGKFQGAKILSGKSVHSKHCAIVVAHSVSAQL